MASALRSHDSEGGAAGAAGRPVVRKTLKLRRGTNEMLQSGYTTIGRGDSSTRSLQRRKSGPRKVSLNVQTEFAAD